MTSVTTEKADTTSSITASKPLAPSNSSKKWHTFWIRTITTFMMIGGLFTVLASGHVWVILMVIGIQTTVYNEVVHIAEMPAKARHVRWYKTMSWYYLVTTTYYLYGETLIYYFDKIVLVDAFLLPFATHHRFISFMLYVHFIANNILEGLIWFLLPSSLVICNDIFAYICGTFWGKTPLISLSPKKTVEGFVGAWICTLLFGMMWTALLVRWEYLICPVKDLATSAWNYASCDPKNPVFLAVPWALPPTMATIASFVWGEAVTHVWIEPIQLHAAVMACFASLIAPFGGFFASGVKRAFNIKDFGTSIPGHGGMTDRMDCQLMMGLFSFMYYQSFIKAHTLSAGSILGSIVHGIPLEEQLELLERLLTYFVNQGVLDAAVLDYCGATALTDTAKLILDSK
ncbi:cytidylyltransferase family-domain-containing protein [Gongronella butleri]|nr:cytidylyltransferase family-domain-containing protein [Gongronella butleri]